MSTLDYLGESVWLVQRFLDSLLVEFVEAVSGL